MLCPDIARNVNPKSISIANWIRYHDTVKTESKDMFVGVNPKNKYLLTALSEEPSIQVLISHDNASFKHVVRNEEKFVFNGFYFKGAGSEDHWQAQN